MNRAVSSLLILVVFGLVCGLVSGPGGARTLAAQQAGHPVVHASNGSGTYAMHANPTNGSLSTINVAINQQTHVMTAVQMAPDNMSIVFAANARSMGPHYIGVYNPQTQSTTTLAQSNVPFLALVPSQLGGYFTYSGTSVYHVASSGMLTTVRANLPGVISALGFDAVSAALLVGSQVGHLWRMSANGQTLTTVANGLGSVRSVDCSPRTGNYVVTTNVAPQLRVLSRLGALVAFFTLANISSAWVDPITGIVWMAELYRIYQLTETLTVINSWMWANPQLSILSMMLYAWRVVATAAALQPTVPFFVSLYFPQMAGAAYVAALSLAIRPGIGLGNGRRLNLFADPLFFAVVAQGLFVQNFSGILNANGGAMASLRLPNGVPPGVIIYIAAIAILSNQIAISNTWPVMC